MKEAKTIGSGTNNNVVRGTISEILKYNPKNDTYKVKYDIPDGDGDDAKSEYIDTIKSKELRANKPLIYSKLELEFFDRKSKINK
jgi:hypothetical protein